jgi:hypothetical protein
LIAAAAAGKCRRAALGASPGTGGGAGGRMKYLLLVIPSLISLCVPFYNVTEPQLFGFPFFYWLLLSLIPLSSLLTFIVYKGEKM